MRTHIHTLLVHMLAEELCHPCASPLSVTRMEVGIEHRQEGSVLVIDIESLHLIVVDRDALILLEGQAVELGGQAEHTLLHMLQLEVWAEQFVVDAIFLVT